MGLACYSTRQLQESYHYQFPTLHGSMEGMSSPEWMRPQEIKPSETFHFISNEERSLS
jgi:hypothetical protein